MKKTGSLQTVHRAASLVILLAATWMVSRPELDPLSVSAYSRISPNRTASDKILLVTLDDRDIESLGGWPVSRDYHAYMIHALTSCGAKTIGMDFLFRDRDTLFQEYDQALADFIRSSDRVVLPTVFQSGNEVLSPAHPFQEHATLGFSNLGDQTPVCMVPLTVSVRDNRLYSFGFQLARRFLGAEEPTVDGNRILLNLPAGGRLAVPVDERGRFLPDYFGGIGKIKTIGFVELLHTFQAAPDSLDLEGKLVLVAPTAQTLPVIKQIPGFGAAPGSLIHLTVAENLIIGRILRQVPAWFSGIILAALSVLTVGMIWTGRIRSGLALLASFIVLWTLPAWILYRESLILLPLTPFFFALFGVICLSGLYAWAEYAGQKQRSALLETEIDRTMDALIRVRSKKRMSEREKEQAVHRLEKHLRDLEAIRLPELRTGDPGGIIHAPGSPMRDILKQMRTVAKDTIPVLILGETGTGKELIARAVHQNSLRKDREFMAVNCGALSENLLESELFGHERGAFTGAHARRLGRFEQAHGGTLFLDEIAETSPAFQARLLRVLQEGVFERVGGQQPIRTDVRIVAATNRDLRDEVDAGRFRADLYFRLNGFPIRLPPLRDRRMDIPLLVSHFLSRNARKGIRSLSKTAMDRIEVYNWPGNVRELENAVRRAALLAESRGRDRIGAEDLPDEMRPKTGPDSPPLGRPMGERILSLLRAHGFSRSAITRTAGALGGRDRGTVTEYFRGLCFQAVVRNGYRIRDAAVDIAGADDAKTVARVEKKIRGYLENVYSIHEEGVKQEPRPSAFQGLPKAFHPFLEDLIRNKKRLR